MDVRGESLCSDSTCRVYIYFLWWREELKIKPILTSYHIRSKIYIVLCGFYVSHWTLLWLGSQQISTSAPNTQRAETSHTGTLMENTKSTQRKHNHKQFTTLLLSQWTSTTAHFCCGCVSVVWLSLCRPGVWNLQHWFACDQTVWIWTSLSTGI